MYGNETITVCGAFLEKKLGLSDLEDLRPSTSYYAPSLPGLTHIVESFWSEKAKLPVRPRRCTWRDELVE